MKAFLDLPYSVQAIQGVRFDLMRLIVWEFADLTSANDGRIII